MSEPKRLTDGELRFILLGLCHSHPAAGQKLIAHIMAVEAELAEAKSTCLRGLNVLEEVRSILTHTSPLDLGPRLQCVKLIDEALGDTHER